jgi:aspartate racemase
MKTIGVLGGIGPQATMDFEMRIHYVAQQWLPQQANSGYPPMVVVYIRHAPPVLTESGAPQFPLNPDPRFLEAARQVGALADFLVVIANAPHLFQVQIEQAAARQVLSMIEVTLQDVQRRGWSRLGVLGLGDPLVYTIPLGQLGIAYEMIEAELQTKLDAAIWELMEGRAEEDASAVAREAVAVLRARSVDGIILGCTEIPLLLGAESAAADLINPAQLLAEAAVRRAMGWNTLDG